MVIFIIWDGIYVNLYIGGATIVLMFMPMCYVHIIVTILPITMIQIFFYKNRML